MNLRHDGKNRRNNGHHLWAHAGDRVGSDLLLLLNDGAAAAKDGHENRVAGIILLRRQSQCEKKPSLQQYRQRAQTTPLRAGPIHFSRVLWQFVFAALGERRGSGRAGKSKPRDKR